MICLLRLSEELQTAVGRADELQALNTDLSNELDSCALREGQRIEDSQRRFDEIVQLQTDRLQLVSQVRVYTDTSACQSGLTDFSLSVRTES